MMTTATKPKAAPRPGGPQGLTSWATPERMGARTRPRLSPTAPCPEGCRQPAPRPTVSWRSVMQVLPMAVEKDRSTEQTITRPGCVPRREQQQCRREHAGVQQEQVRLVAKAAAGGAPGRAGQDALRALLQLVR